MIQPATGGETRVLPRLPLPMGRLPRIVAATWSADSRALLVVNEDFAVWRVPTDGSPAQATGLMFPGNVTRISAHPDGRRLAISLQFTQNAVFVLENPGAMKGGGR